MKNIFLNMIHHDPLKPNKGLTRIVILHGEEIQKQHVSKILGFKATDFLKPQKGANLEGPLA